MKWLRSTLSAALMLPATLASADPFSFVALGDMPYGDDQVTYPLFGALIGEINRYDPAFVIHVGDIKSGGSLCTNEKFQEQLDFMMTVDAPLIYTPGDNEWTDCHRTRAGEYDPLERLSALREIFFAEPELTLGEPVPVDSQVAGGFPENTYFEHDDIAVIAAHVVGSNNGFEPRVPEAAIEFFARDAANIAWLRAGFERAADKNVIVVAIHADMFEFDFDMFGNRRWLRHSGFINFGAALREEVKRYGKPVLLIFGDSHVFRVFRPFRDSLPNLMALEVFGANHMHAVEVNVDTTRPSVFGFAPVLNPQLSDALD